MAATYQNGKIYKLVSNVDDYFYIGSTRSTLAKRLAQHRKQARQTPRQAVYAHFNRIGWTECRIILIENYSCANKEGLVRKEFEYIQQNHTNAKLLNTYRFIGCVCEHNKQRAKCKECNGSQICEHDKFKQYCKECLGGSICEHLRVRSRCKDCDGGSICEHSKHRAQCKDCCGDKYYCYECDLNFCKPSILKNHIKTKKHKDTYKQMFEELILH